VSVLDITCIISYILEEEPQPFLFEAADVNYDGNINVLDMVLVIQMITAQKNLAASHPSLDMPEYIYLSDSAITLESKNQVAALQFELYGDQLESVKLFAEIEGFEFNYSVFDDRIIGILFSYQNTAIPDGMIQLLRIESNNNNLSWGGILGCDTKGEQVPIETGKPGNYPVPKVDLALSPNPFSNNTEISFNVPRKSFYQVQIYSSDGKMIFESQGSSVSEGIVQLKWDGKSHSGGKLASGIYICNLKIKPFSGAGILVNHSIKLVKLH
jgi:hypothetical protein